MLSSLLRCNRAETAVSEIRDRCTRWQRGASCAFSLSSVSLCTCSIQHERAQSELAMSGLVSFPQYNFLVSPPTLYGVPAAYVVVAIAGNFMMRGRPAYDVSFAMKLCGRHCPLHTNLVSVRRNYSSRVLQVQHRTDRPLHLHVCWHVPVAWVSQHLWHQRSVHGGASPHIEHSRCHMVARIRL